MFLLNQVTEKVFKAIEDTANLYYTQFEVWDPTRHLAAPEATGYQSSFESQASKKQKKRARKILINWIDEFLRGLRTADSATFANHNRSDFANSVMQSLSFLGGHMSRTEEIFSGRTDRHDEHCEHVAHEESHREVSPQVAAGPIDLEMKTLVDSKPDDDAMDCDPFCQSNFGAFFQ